MVSPSTLIFSPQCESPAVTSDDKPLARIVTLIWPASKEDSSITRTTSPCRINATRSHVTSISLNKCELRNTLVPCSRNSRMMSRTRRRPTGSRPDVGSSKKISRGQFNNTCASPMRCNMPLEKVCNNFLRKSDKPTLSSNSLLRNLKS